MLLGGLWGYVGCLSGFCASAEGPPKAGGMEGRLCLEDAGARPEDRAPFPARVPRQKRSSAGVMLTLPHVPEGTASPDSTDTCSSFNLAFQGS